MRLLPLLATLLGYAAAIPQQQPLGPADDASSLTAVPPTPTPPPPGTDGRKPDCRALDAVFRGIDTAVEGAAHAGAAGFGALYVCRRAAGRDCGLVGGAGAGAAASLFFLLGRLGAGGFGWPSVDDVAFCASAGSLAYMLYLSVWSDLASRRTGTWLAVTFFQALVLLYRGLRGGMAPGEGTRLLLLGWGQTVGCLLLFFVSALHIHQPR